MGFFILQIQNYINTILYLKVGIPNFSKQSADDYGNESYFESFLDKTLVAEDNHVLFNIKSDLNHPDQKFIFDFSELQMNIFIPLLGESVFLTNREFVDITTALKD